MICLTISICQALQDKKKDFNITHLPTLVWPKLRMQPSAPATTHWSTSHKLFSQTSAWKIIHFFLSFSFLRQYCLIIWQLNCIDISCTFQGPFPGIWHYLAKVHLIQREISSIYCTGEEYPDIEYLHSSDQIWKCCRCLDIMTQKGSRH